MIFRKAMIAHDKGKPAARQGRKAVSLSEGGTVEFNLRSPSPSRDCLVAEGDPRKPSLQKPIAGDALKVETGFSGIY